MPLEESILSQEPDGTPNVAYCQWCYTGGKFVYETQEALIDFLPTTWPIPSGRRSRSGPTWPSCGPIWTTGGTEERNRGLRSKTWKTRRVVHATTRRVCL